MIRAVAPHLDAEAEVRKLESREADDHDGVVVMPGAVDLVRSDSRRPLGRGDLGNSAFWRPRGCVLPEYRFPRSMVTADDVVNGKPHPEPYLKGAELLGVNPEECLVIEDAPAGIRAAHAGGMKVIASDQHLSRVSAERSRCRGAEASADSSLVRLQAS